MSQIPSDHVYTEYVPKTKTTYLPEVEQTVSGSYQDAGVVPGFWTGTWRAQVGSNIDTGFFGGTVAAITSPAQFIQAKSAKNTIFNGVINIADREVSKGPKYSEKLYAIQSDESKIGKDWWEALPEKVRQDASEMGITPTNYDYDAQTFAEDFKETYAWSTYMRDASRTAANHSGFTNFAGNLLLGAATDPTSLLSFGIGKVGGTAGKLLGSVGKVTKLDTFGGNLALQTALGSIQNVDAMIHRDFQSERLGIQPGDITTSDYITSTIEGAAINALTATGLHGVGYFSRMAINGVKQKISMDALDFAKGTQANLHKDVMTPEEFKTLFDGIQAGRALKPSEQVPILREVLSQYGLNLHDDSFYDYASFEAIGMHPVDVAAKILHEGLSPHQVTTLFNNAAMVADDAQRHTPGPLPKSALMEAMDFKPTEPVVNVEKQLPKYVTDAGYQFDAVGNLVKGAAPVTTPAATLAPWSGQGDFAGWKLHLSTSNPEAVSAMLKDMGYAHKVGRNSGQTGKDVTVYVGHKDAATEAARLINERAGSLLNDPMPTSDAAKDDTSFGGKVLGRFDTPKGSQFHQYGASGVPFLASDMDPFNQTGTTAEKITRANAALQQTYGDTFTGTPTKPVAEAPPVPAVVNNVPTENLNRAHQGPYAPLEVPKTTSPVADALDAGEADSIRQQADMVLRGSDRRFKALKELANKNPKGWQAETVTKIEAEIARRSQPTPAVKPIVEAPKVAEAPPARQGLDAEVIDPMTPPKAKAGQSEDPIANALMKSKDAQDFAVKLGDMLAEGKLVMTKEIKDRIKTIIGSYEMAKDLALKTSAEVTGPKVTEADLKARATKVTGRSDTLVPQDKAGKRQIEFPNLRDRLIWMASKGFPEVRGEAEKILNDFYGLGIREIRNLRTAIKESIAAAGKPGRGVDRLKVTRNPDGSFKTEILRSLGGPKERSIGDAVKALTPESAAKADAYAKKHNLNVQNKINKTREKIVGKGDSVIEPTFAGVKDLKPKDAKEYAMAIKQGKLDQAYQILADHNMGENNASKIAELFVRSKNARLALETAVRNGVSAEINKAKAALDGVHSEFNKIKLAMFAASDTQLGRVTLGTKMLAGQNRLLRTLAGTPIEPAHQFYVEPVGVSSGREGVMSDALLMLNRAFAKADPNNLAAIVSTNIPDGMFANAANAILKLDGTFFIKSEAGRALTDKTPMASLLVDLVDTYRLESAALIGKKSMSPSLGTMYRMIEVEANASVKRMIDFAKKLGIGPDSEDFLNASFDAKVELATGTKNSKANRPLVDMFLKEYRDYYEKGSHEGILAGKIRKHDPNYVRVTLNHLAQQDLPGVSDALFESHVRFFSKDDSSIHEGTLQKVHPIEILKVDGSPIETLKDLKDANPQVANDYLRMLAYDMKDAPLRNMSDRGIRVRMGIEVADDVSINREVSYYMNSGLGKHLDSELLLNNSMRKYIETNPYNILYEYNRNVRYYAKRQEAINKFIQNLFGQDIKGITWNDLMDYSERRLQDIYGDTNHKDISAFFQAIKAKEAQVTNRLGGKNAGNAGLDGLMTLAIAPIQPAVTGGIGLTSQVMDGAKSFVKAMYSGIFGPEAGGTGMFRSFASVIRSMSKSDILAGKHAMMSALEHASLYDVDHVRMSYAGGPVATKINLVKKAFQKLAGGVTGMTDSSIPMGSRFRNFAQGVNAAFNEPVRQLSMIDNLTAVTADAYHGAARWEFSAYIEQMLKDPDFFKKDRGRGEILSRMEAVGLFSKNAQDGLKAINKFSPDFFSKDWTVGELNELMLKMRADVDIGNDTFKNVQDTYNALWKACDDYVDSRLMTLPRVWDVADSGKDHALNRFLNTFTGYSRWFFSRNMLQRFPTSSSYKVAMLGAWYVMAEAVSMLMRDALLDWDKFNQMADDVDDDLAETYLTQALMRVPTMGQLTNAGFGGARQAWNLLAPAEYQTPTNNYRGGTLYSGYVWKAGFQEVSKAARGETYDMDKVRKLIPFMNAPMVGGFFHEDK